MNIEKILKKMQQNPFYSPSKDVIDLLRKHVDSYSEFDVQNVSNLLHERYQMTLPLTLIKDILKNNLSLVHEVHYNSISETYPREVLLDSFLNCIGLPETSWPRISDSDENTKSIMEQIHKQGQSHGVVFHYLEPEIKDSKKKQKTI